MTPSILLIAAIVQFPAYPSEASCQAELNRLPSYGEANWECPAYKVVKRWWPDMAPEITQQCKTDVDRVERTYLALYRCMFPSGRRR